MNFKPKADYAQIITKEAHKVPLQSPFNFTLAYVPMQSQPSSISIPGFTETESDPQQGQFHVAYDSGVITFHYTAAEQDVLVDYKAAGDVIKAQCVNDLQDAVVSIIRKGTLAELKAQAAQDQFIAWATDKKQCLFYTADKSIGDEGFIVLGQ